MKTLMMRGSDPKSTLDLNRVALSLVSCPPLGRLFAASVDLWPSESRSDSPLLLHLSSDGSLDGVEVMPLETLQSKLSRAVCGHAKVEFTLPRVVDLKHSVQDIQVLGGGKKERKRERERECRQSRRRNSSDELGLGLIRLGFLSPCPRPGRRSRLRLLHRRAADRPHRRLPAWPVSAR